MLGLMGEHSDSETERADDTVDEQVDDGKEVVAAEPRESDRRVVPDARTRSSTGRWLGLAALLVALAALAIALINVIRPDWTEKFDKTPVTTAAPPPGPSQQEIDAAKAKTCDAYNAVGAAVTARTNTPIGPDPLQTEIININARQAFSTGHDFLMTRVDPATPPPLAEAIRNFATNLEDVAINSLAGVNNDDAVQAGRLQSMVDLNGQINELCK